jgi:hypothetical protein
VNGHTLGRIKSECRQSYSVLSKSRTASRKIEQELRKASCSRRRLRPLGACRPPVRHPPLDPFEAHCCIYYSGTVHFHITATTDTTLVSCFTNTVMSVPPALPDSGTSFLCCIIFLSSLITKHSSLSGSGKYLMRGDAFEEQLLTTDL